MVLPLIQVAKPGAHGPAPARRGGWLARCHVRHRATLHKDDEAALRHLLRVPASYVGLIASEKRARLLLDWLGAETSAHPALHAPAGLDIAARGPAEIALSILAEIVLCRYPAQTENPFVHRVAH